MGCGYTTPDGSLCHQAAFVFDTRRSIMLCRDHGVAPLERVFGPRPDLEEKADYVLRFLGLPSLHRHELLEALGAEERREFLHLARLFDTTD